MPLTVPGLRVLEACRGQRIDGPLVLRPVSGKPIDRRYCYRLVARIAKAAGIPRHISPHSPSITIAHEATTTTTGVHFLTAYVVGVDNVRPRRSECHVPSQAD
ncbi:MAG TPA: hypothetical protein VFG63_01595 [Nocardioidaceae bacterium]|nr:hypothetical protein [Nocardioidaceae bacterium]